MSADRIVRPAGHDESVFIVNVSGGKDSTATILAMREAEIPCRYVFADTGWEMPQTYEYLAYLERKLGITIDRVGKRGGMIGMIKSERSFPNPRVSWCTDKLKIRPLRRYFEAVAEETDCDTVSVVGIRAEESARRAEMPEFQFDDRWGGYVWRPIMGWLVADVLAAHHRHGVEVNPLYRLGFDRVGCAPCKNSTKAQIELFATLAPERIALLRELEAYVAESRGPDSSAPTTMFSDMGKPMPIDTAVAWSRTSHGGVQLKLLRQEPDSGCFRWGLCDAPSKDNADE
jgi:3'-phosphoadenosine 5'-phosphosulfate sulfotransferase (PAPS reductase)/FAD synthetase